MQLYVPEGYLHGFVTLEPDTQVVYKVSDEYAPEAEAGVRFDDRTLALPWPLDGRTPVVSDKDVRLPHLSEFSSRFDYDGVPLGPLGMPEG